MNFTIVNNHQTLTNEVTFNDKWLVMGNFLIIQQILRFITIKNRTEINLDLDVSLYRPKPRTGDLI